MNLGQWLGQWAGQWFGALEELPPGFMRGSAAITLSAAATLVDGAAIEPPQPEPVPGFGGGLPWREWVRRPKEEDEALLLAVLH